MSSAMNTFVGDEHVLAFHALAQILMGNDGVAAVHNAAVIAALVEHAQVHAQHTGVVHVAVDGALVGADDHEAVRGGLEVGDVLEHGLHHLVGGHHVVHAHQGHRVGHPGVVGVEGDDVGHAHALQLLQRVAAWIRRFRSW